MLEDILIQLLVTVVGGFVLNIVWTSYEKHIEKKHKLYTSQILRIKKIFKCNPVVKYIVCFLIMFILLNTYINICRLHNKMDKDWIEFEWIVFEDDNIGNNFLSPNCDLYVQKGENDRELIVRQVDDTLLVQVYHTDFDINKPNVFFSKNNIYTLVTENKRVNLFNNITGEFIDSFLIQDEEIRAVYFDEDKQIIYYETIVEKYGYRISKYSMADRQVTEDDLWTNTILLGVTSGLDYYLGLNYDMNKLFAASLSDFNEVPVYGEKALQLCTNGVSSIVFEKNGKYYLDLSTSYSTRIEIKECSSNNIIYSMNVYELKECFFDEQDNLYVVHQGYVDKIDLLTRKKKTIIDLSTIAKRKGEKRVKEDYSFISCCLINDSRYLAGIVYEPSYNYNRIYIFDMNTEEIVAMSNSIGELAENGYADIVEYNETLYAEIIGNRGNSAIYYTLLFDDNKNLVFSEN